MVAAFDFCLHGKGGAAPSIDTAMHGLVDAPHVDHLHPDSGIALATAADGEKLTADCFGDRVVWVPWRRPGFQLGLDIATVREENPQAIGVHPRRTRHHRVGRHLRGVRGELAGDHPHRPGLPRPARGRRAVRPGRARLRAAARGRAPGQGRGDLPDDPRARLHRPPAGRPLHRQRRRAGVPRAGEARRVGRAGHVLPRPLPAHQGQAAGRGPARHRDRRGDHRPAAGAARGLPRGLRRLLRAARHPGLAAHARRRPGHRARARRWHVLLRHATSRPRGWRASSTSTRST